MSYCAPVRFCSTQSRRIRCRNWKPWFGNRMKLNVGHIWLHATAARTDATHSGRTLTLANGIFSEAA